MDQSEYGGLSNIGGRQPTFAVQASVIPTIDSGKPRRMAGGNRTGNADAKSGKGFQDDTVSNRGRSGFQGQEVGRSSSPFRDARY